MQKRPQKVAAVAFGYQCGELFGLAGLNGELVALRVVPKDGSASLGAGFKHAHAVSNERAGGARHGNVHPAAGAGLGEGVFDRLDGPEHEGQVSDESLRVKARAQKRVAGFGRRGRRGADAPEGHVERGEGGADRIALDADADGKLRDLLGRALLDGIVREREGHVLGFVEPDVRAEVGAEKRYGNGAGVELEPVGRTGRSARPIGSGRRELCAAECREDCGKDGDQDEALHEGPDVAIKRHIVAQSGFGIRNVAYPSLSQRLRQMPAGPCRGMFERPRRLRREPEEPAGSARGADSR